MRKGLKSKAVNRLGSGDIDLVLAMGTWAGQDLATDDHKVPTIVMSTSNPIAAGIINGPDDSGRPHVHARVDPSRYRRQLRLFYEIFGFKRLGVVYEDSVEGRTYAAIEDIEESAARLGFEVVSCKAPFSGIAADQAAAGVAACHRELAPKVDAVFVTVHRGVSCEKMPDILAPLFERNLPTWSQRGSDEVRGGATMSISRADFSGIGYFHAKTIATVFNGAEPGSLPQTFEDPMKIAVNLGSAARIGYDIPFEVLSVADEIFEEIPGPESCK